MSNSKHPPTPEARLQPSDIGCGSLQRLDVTEDSPPQTDWICKPYCARNTLSLCYGDGGAGKSYIMTDLALHIATGEEWLDLPIPKARRVAYIDADGLTAQPFALRIYNLRRGLDVRADDLRENFFAIPPQGWTLGQTKLPGREGGTYFDDPGQQNLITLIEKYCLEYVFIDVLSSIHHRDESNESMREIVRHSIGKVVRDTGVGICLLAHVRKFDQRIGAKKRKDPPTLHDVRGGGEAVNATDIAFAVHRFEAGSGLLRLDRNRFIDPQSIPPDIGVINYQRTVLEKPDAWAFERCAPVESLPECRQKVVDFLSLHAAALAGLSGNKVAAFAKEKGLGVGRSTILQVLKESGAK